MNEAGLAQAAHLLAEARRSGGVVGALPLDCRPTTLAEAHAIQERLHRHLAESGPGARIGYKIGGTSKTMQNYLGVDHPCCGGLFKGSVQSSPASVSLTQFRRLGIELEIAVQLSHDLPARPAPYSAAEASAAVGACHGSIELVDDRYEDWRSIGTPTLVADDFFSAGCVLGAPHPQQALESLDEERCQFFVDDFSTAIGYGRDILGNPLNALLWLVNNQPFAEGLRAGQIITLGSVAQTQWIEQPCRIEARYGTLGTLGLAVEA